MIQAAPGAEVPIPLTRLALSDYEREQVAAIRAWRAAEPGAVARVIDRATAPLAWLAHRAIPEAAVRRVLHAGNALARRLADAEDVRREAGVSHVRELRDHDDLRRLDQLAASVQRWAIGIGAGQGAATGALGLPGIVLDIPAAITIALRTVHKVALCYGFPAEEEADVQFVFAVLSAAGANSRTEKKAAVGLLRSVNGTLLRRAWVSQNADLALNLTEGSALIAVRSLARQLGVNLTRRRALAIVPAVGAVVGGSANAWWLREVGWAARRSYQERWLVGQGKLGADGA